MKSVKERLSALRAAMAQANCDAYIMPTSDPHASEYVPAHFTTWEYFSGFYCENANLVVTADEAAMWVDGRFFGAADTALQGTGIESMHMGVKGVPTVDAWLKEHLGKGKVLGCCAQTMPLSQSRKLEKTCESVGASLQDLPQIIDDVWGEDRPALPATPVWTLDVKYSGRTAKEKLAILRGKLAEKTCTAMVITRLDSIAWLLNLRASDVEDTPYALAFCYVDEEHAVLFLDESRVPQSVKEELGRAKVELRAYEAMPSYLAAVQKDETVLIDAESLNASLYHAVCGNPHYTVVEADDPIVMLKAIKNDTELSCTRQAHLNDAVAMVRFQMELEECLKNKKSLRETDIDTILHKYRSSNENFLTESFPTIAAYGANAAMMHYAPKVGSDAAIENKGFLLVDSGATYYDGTTDITRTYPVGEVSEEEKLAYTRVLRAHIDIAMAVWLEGATGGELDMIARQPLWRHMIDYRCGTGHGVAHVGTVHEDPQQIRPHNKIVFEPGMVITDEPGIYEEGIVGVRIENELLCTQAGENQYGKFLRFEPITYVPIAVSCVLLDELTREEKAWLNEYHAQVLEKLSLLLREEECAWLREKCAAI